jgi:hypothetical protein
MDIEYTARGFAHIGFTDRYGEACSLQDSSLATDDAIWLGVDHIDAERWRGMAGVNMRAIPARMHLTRDQVEQLLPFLQRFVEGGSICTSADDAPPALKELL